jgi:hypothetical protein
MNIELLTKEDLAEIKLLLLEALPSLKQNTVHAINPKWIRGSRVQELLGISNTKLQDLRQSGKLTFTKFGNIYYYDIDQVFAEMERNKVKCRECA